MKMMLIQHKQRYIQVYAKGVTAPRNTKVRHLLVTERLEAYQIAGGSKPVQLNGRLGLIK
jgi:hypothetical protein